MLYQTYDTDLVILARARHAGCTCTMYIQRSRKPSLEGLVSLFSSRVNVESSLWRSSPDQGVKLHIERLSSQCTRLKEGRVKWLHWKIKGQNAHNREVHVHTCELEDQRACKPACSSQLTYEQVPYMYSIQIHK